MATLNSRDCVITEQDESVQELREEQEHFKKVVKAFLHYSADNLFFALYSTTPDLGDCYEVSDTMFKQAKAASSAVLVEYNPHLHARLKRLEDNYLGLPPSHRHMLPDMPAHIQRLRQATEVNQSFVDALVGSSRGMFENSEVSRVDVPTDSQPHPPTPFDMTKVLTTVKQFYRDWSSEGKAERDMCYEPIITGVLEHFPLDKCEPADVSILVPGSGLGRLAFELARQGYMCQGNEFSMYMLLGSNFILNQSSGVNSHVIYPWIHQFSNTWSCDHQLTCVTVPDVDPCDLPRLGLFSMAAGDFLMIYTEPDEWDAVVCCFFIDTAHNIIGYLQRIYHILKPGGIWINFGPLLYHYADTPGERSIELSWTDVIRIATVEIGFELTKEERHKPATYIQNPHSMLQMTYDCVFLVARKPVSSSTHHTNHHTNTAGNMSRTSPVIETSVDK